jgi:hypothetical protein
MNRLGIALASDSAATVYVGDRAKVYHADKLFMLSHSRPVGAMVYSNSSLLGVPWETILKMFRQHLQKKSFPTLEKYGEELIRWLDNNTTLFPQQAQDHAYLELVETIFGRVEAEIAEAIGDAQRRRKGDGARRDEIVAEVIATTLAEWLKKDNVTCFDPVIGEQMAGRKSGEVAFKVQEVFKHRKLQASAIQSLHKLAALVVSKNHILPESRTGLVVAGFGDNEHLPVMQQYQLGEIFGNRLKFRRLDSRRIDDNTGSIVEPFAEIDMVSTFLNGISPEFELSLLNDVAYLVFGIPAVMLEQIRMRRARKEELKDRFRKHSQALVKEWRDSMKERIKTHRSPILRSIEFLPKDELAHVAASLVNLNSFQKRMSIHEDETVGGPIDVAVISKGDGFVWIDRKHYFKPHLNPHFFKNYGTPPTPPRSPP